MQNNGIDYFFYFPTFADFIVIIMNMLSVNYFTKVLSFLFKLKFIIRKLQF